MPVSPRAIASTAATPNRVPRTRSKAFGVPPRWTWPRMVIRDLVAGPLLDRSLERDGDPAEPCVPERVGLAVLAGRILADRDALPR